MSNCSIGKQYRVKEKWETKKFFSGFNILNPVWWAKTLNEFFRIVIILSIIVGIIFASGYWQGMKRKPVKLGYKDFIAYVEKDGETHKIEVKNNTLRFDDKIVRAQDIPELKPYGIKIRPKLFAGISNSADAEVGIGAEVFHYFKWNLDVFGTQKGAYIGVSHEVELAEWIQNSSVGVAMGKAWDNPNDNRFLFYWSTKW